MGTVQESTQLIWAWAQQRIWSLTANRLKRRIDQARLAALALGIATAVLAVAAHQVGGLSVLAGQVLSAAASVTAGAATLVQRRVSTGQIRDWTRARSASEGLKTEIYSYRGGAAAYTGSDPDQRLGEKTGGIVEAVGDLQRHTLGILPDTKPIPLVHDVDSYIALRVNDQIDKYYKKKAALYEKRVRRLRRAGDVRGVTALVLAAVAAAFKVDSLNAWVPSSPLSAPRWLRTSRRRATTTWLSNFSAPPSAWKACAANAVISLTGIPRLSSTPAKPPSPR